MFIRRDARRFRPTRHRNRALTLVRAHQVCHRERMVDRRRLDTSRLDDDLIEEK